jgi:hypothetical protein
MLTRGWALGVGEGFCEQAKAKSGRAWVAPSPVTRARIAAKNAEEQNSFKVDAGKSILHHCIPDPVPVRSTGGGSGGQWRRPSEGKRMQEREQNGWRFCCYEREHRTANRKGNGDTSCPFQCWTDGDG